MASNHSSNPSGLMTSRTQSAAFASPGTPPYADFEVPKGWASERVPRSGHPARRHVAAAALMPFSSGRALPSKWDDAERWISSPVSVGNAPIYSSYSGNYYYAPGVARGCQYAGHPSQRRAKSKSGPLGPAGLASYGSLNSFSPVLGVGVIHGGKWRNSLTIESPGLGLAPARMEDGLAVSGSGASDGGGGRRSCPGPDWLDSWSGPPSPIHKGSSAEENVESIENENADENSYEGEAAEGVDGAVSRRDMATQMFPDSESSSCPSPAAGSSPRSSVSTATPPRPLPDEPRRRDARCPESEVRDVQVDKQTSIPRRSSSSERAELLCSPSSSTITVETDKKVSNSLRRLRREEARINAWENLQKAKAEAAIQKLEMKLEKKRSSSMEKIVEKLRRAEIKAQRMRSLLSSNGDEQLQRQQSRAVSRTTAKLPSFVRKLRLSSTVRSCTTCYPF